MTKKILANAANRLHARLGRTPGQNFRASIRERWLPNLASTFPTSTFNTIAVPSTGSAGGKNGSQDPPRPLRAQELALLQHRRQPSKVRPPAPPSKPLPPT